MSGPAALSWMVRDEHLSVWNVTICKNIIMLDIQ